MTNLKKADIRHLAALAHIGVTDEEVKIYSQQLSSILDYVEQLNSVDTSNLKPTSQVTGLSTVSRDDDDQSDTMSTGRLLDQTPATDSQNIKVPKVI